GERARARGSRRRRRRRSPVLLLLLVPPAADLPVDRPRAPARARRAPRRAPPRALPPPPPGSLAPCRRAVLCRRPLRHPGRRRARRLLHAREGDRRGPGGASVFFAALPPLVSVPTLLVGPASLLFAAAVDGGLHQFRLVTHRPVARP